VSLDTFAPTTNPSTEGSQRGVKRRVNAAQFGDGYSQRSSDGLNTSARTFTANWSQLEETEAATYEAFFDAHDATPFLWTLPGETVQRKFIAGDSTMNYLDGDLVSFSCPLTEVFDL
jgi:phage-related protein